MVAIVNLVAIGSKRNVNPIYRYSASGQCRIFHVLCQNNIDTERLWSFVRRLGYIIPWGSLTGSKGVQTQDFFFKCVYIFSTTFPSAPPLSNDLCMSTEFH